ncbi:MAG: Fe-S cluster assembly protein SufD [Hyphomicrobiales bacterium]|nr:Fe-S cluster assembly protein SufD [Hyphomicrobiales bacterium]
MNIPVKHTTGEEAVLSLLQDAGPQASHVLESISQRGLPTRRVEAWHYTDLRNLLKHYPAVASSSESAAKNALAACKNPLPCVELPIINGGYCAELATTLPQKMLVASQTQTVDATDIASDDTIGLLNSGLVTGGLTIAVNDDAHIDDRICLSHIMTEENSAASRHNVKIGARASITLMERHLTTNSAAAVTNTVCDLELADNSIVTWVIDQQMSELATRFGQLNVKLGKQAELTILSLNSGCKLVRQEIRVEVLGEGSRLNISGVNLIGHDAHIDVTTKLDHLVPNTVSTETFRNVVAGNGRGVFQGQINVAQIAQGTDARMACNSLLLSDASEFSAKPELEIFADDVQCAHGATVSDIDENHLFYLMARGIPEKLSRDMLIKAFVAEVFDGLAVEQIGKELNNRIDNWLDNNG